MSRRSRPALGFAIVGFVSNPDDWRSKHPKIYMIDFVDPGDEEELDEIIKENYQRIFENELASWNNIKREWPMSRSFEIFKEWFDIIVTDVGYDLSNEQLAYEND